MQKVLDITTFDFKASAIEIEVKNLDFIKALPHILGKPHKARFYQVIYIEEGEFTCFIDFKQITLKANELLFISIGQVCEYDILNEYKGRLILFTEAFFSTTEQDAKFLYTSEILSPISTNQVIEIQQSVVKPLLILLEGELTKEIDTFQAIITQNYLRIILLESERQLKTTTCEFTQSNIIRDFYNLLELHFKSNRNTNFYCELLGVSEKALSKQLKVTIGNTPKVSIDARVVLEAKRLLSYSPLSIKEIGYELGFEEPTNFNKYFKKHTNQTPNDFRALLSK